MQKGSTTRARIKSSTVILKVTSPTKTPRSCNSCILISFYTPITSQFYPIPKFYCSSTRLIPQLSRRSTCLGASNPFRVMASTANCDKLPEGNLGYVPPLVSGLDFAIVVGVIQLIRLIPTHGASNPIVIEGSLEAKLPTIWRDENAVRSAGAQRCRKSEERRCRCAKR